MPELHAALAAQRLCAPGPAHLEQWLQGVGQDWIGGTRPPSFLPEPMKLFRPGGERIHHCA